MPYILFHHMMKNIYSWYTYFSFSSYDEKVCLAWKKLQIIQKTTKTKQVQKQKSKTEKKHQQCLTGRTSTSSFICFVLLLCFCFGRYIFWFLFYVFCSKCVFVILSIIILPFGLFFIVFIFLCLFFWFLHAIHDSFIIWWKISIHDIRNLSHHMTKKYVWHEKIKKKSNKQQNKQR